MGCSEFEQHVKVKRSLDNISVKCVELVLIVLTKAHRIQHWARVKLDFPAAYLGLPCLKSATSQNRVGLFHGFSCGKFWGWHFLHETGKLLKSAVGNPRSSALCWYYSTIKYGSKAQI